MIRAFCSERCREPCFLKHGSGTVPEYFSDCGERGLSGKQSPPQTPARRGWRVQAVPPGLSRSKRAGQLWRSTFLHSVNFRFPAG